MDTGREVLTISVRFPLRDEPAPEPPTPHPNHVPCNTIALQHHEMSPRRNPRHPLEPRPPQHHQSHHNITKYTNTTSRHLITT